MFHFWRKGNLFKEAVVSLCVAIALVVGVWVAFPSTCPACFKPARVRAALWKGEEADVVKTRKIVLVDGDGKTHLTIWVDRVPKMEVDTGDGRRIVDLAYIARRLGDRP